MASRGGLGDIGIRCAAGVALVLATINPSGWSYVHWVAGGLDTELPPKLLVGATLAILYVIFVRATLRSIGVAGIALMAVFVAALMWTLVYYGIVNLTEGDRGPIAWLTLIFLGLALGVGLSWSHVRARLSGQRDTDDVDA
ncbi:MAG: DUF6524 family protein [Pseudomonadota bacterium]